MQFKYIWVKDGLNIIFGKGGGLGIDTNIQQVRPMMDSLGVCIDVCSGIMIRVLSDSSLTVYYNWMKANDRKGNILFKQCCKSRFLGKMYSSGSSNNFSIC